MVPVIVSNAELEPVVASVLPHDRVAVDTEADSLHCYFEKLCLIQMAVPGSNWLIDPLAGLDLAPLFQSWAGKEIILHGADYDLRLLRRVGFAGPTRVFDTMIAARLIGVTEFSLAALIERFFGEKLAKASQKANWALRPLPEVMLDYALKDTKYLHQIAEIFEADLDRLGRRHWFEQCCERAIQSAAIDKERSEEEAWRISGSGTLRGRAAAILKELWTWRDAEAQSVDRPTFHILQNQMMIDAAKRLDAGEHVNFHHLRGGRLRRYHEAVERALNLPASEWPKFERPPRPKPIPHFEEQFLVYKRKRDSVATDLKIDPSLIASRSTLENLVARQDEVAQKMMPWQRELLGLA